MHPYGIPANIRLWITEPLIFDVATHLVKRTLSYSIEVMVNIILRPIHDPSPSLSPSVGVMN
jgi:hypothetical protein